MCGREGKEGVQTRLGELVVLFSCVLFFFVFCDFGFCVLDFVFCVLCFVFCVLYFLYLYFVFFGFLGEVLLGKRGVRGG